MRTDCTSTLERTMPQTLDLSAGPIDYEDTGGARPGGLFVHRRLVGGPPVGQGVPPPGGFPRGVHGLLVDGTLWRKVVPRLDGFRCVVPTLPLGSHREPMRDRKALTPIGVADLIAEFMERLELTDVTVVANDTGGAITQLLLTRRPERVARVGFTPCDAFENFLPPAVKPLQWMAKARVLGAALQGMRIEPLRGTPLAYGLLTKRRIPADVLE